MTYSDIMIDLETLGTTMQTVILSVGAIKFNVKHDTHMTSEHPTFYKECTIQDQLSTGAVITGDTLKWWMQQSDNIRLQMFADKNQKQSFPTILMDLGMWIVQHKGLERVWSHGAGFDVPILGEAYATQQKPLPWKYAQARDTRTLFELANIPDIIHNTLKPEGHTAHHALIDAQNQANAVIVAWTHLESYRHDNQDKMNLLKAIDEGLSPNDVNLAIRNIEEMHDVIRTYNAGAEDRES